MCNTRSYVVCSSLWNLGTLFVPSRKATYVIARRVASNRQLSSSKSSSSSSSRIAEQRVHKKSCNFLVQVRNRLLNLVLIYTSRKSFLFSLCSFFWCLRIIAYQCCFFVDTRILFQWLYRMPWRWFILLLPILLLPILRLFKMERSYIWYDGYKYDE